MFTGIVEEVGRVVAVDLRGQDARLVVQGPLVVSDAHLGDSIAVNGVCLTVTELDGQTFAADVMPQTLSLTSLGSLGVGSPVNLERAMAANGRFGGHVVQGHVDGVGQVISRQPGERWDVITISLPRELMRYVVPKGSVTVNGVSLTVVDVTDDQFTVSLIPSTLAHTTWSSAVAGTVVNLEVDVLAKYAERILEQVQR